MCMRDLFQKNKHVFFLFFFLCFIFYGNSLKNKYALDDDYITVTNFPEKGKEFIPNQNLVSKGFGGIVKIWKSRYAHDSESSFDYRPFTTTTFAVEYGIFGQNPFISHLINLLLYFLTVWLSFCIILKLFEDYEFKFTVAFICSLLFLIHPIHTEVVNNLKCRDELLAFSCGLIALWYSLKAHERPTFKSYLLIVFFLLLGVFSKQTAVLFIAIIPLSLLFFRKINLKVSAFLLVSFIIIYISIRFIRINFITEEVVRVFYHFENPLFTTKVTFFQKIIIGIKTLGFYIKFLIFPFPFRFYYGTNTFDISSDINSYFSLGVCFILSCIYFIIKFKNKLLFFSTLVFCGTILPFVNIKTPAAGVVAERFGFFASLGFCLILAILLIPYLKTITFKSPSQLFSKPLIYFSPLILICMVYTWNRNSNWYNKLVLFEHDIPYLEKSAKANSLLANEYFEMLRSPNKKYPNGILIQKCLKHYNASIKNDSSFFTAYNNAGVIHYSYLNDISTAKKYFQLGIRHRPLYAQAYENLGNCYKQEKNDIKAFECYKKSIEINPKQYSAYMSAFNLFFEKKDYNKSIKIIKIAHSSFPNNYELIAQEANCYLMKGDTLGAVTKYEEAYFINPNQYLAQFLSQKFKEIRNFEKAELYKNK